MNEKIIGIIGGMGPEATADLYMKILNATPATKDQDHIHTIINSNPKIPDRVQAILYGGPSPLEELKEIAQSLEQMGATILVMPCITVHYFYKEIQESVGIPIYHVAEGVKDYIVETYSHAKRVGVLSTTATKETGIFVEALSHLTVIHPEAAMQEANVMEAIFGPDGIKLGNRVGRPKDLLKEAADYLINEKQCDLIIAGCTEVELALKKEDISVPLVDPMKVTAEYLSQKY